jgi:DNA-binding response OmpR family regulator
VSATCADRDTLSGGRDEPQAMSVPQILIVDEERVVESIRRSLRATFAIVGKSTALDAVALLDTEDAYDALVLDVDDARDRDVYASLLSDAGRARRIIFVTSATDPRTEAFLASAGRPWLAKPFATKELEAEIRRVVGEAEPKSA